MTDYEQFLEENGLTEADCLREKESVVFRPLTEFEERQLRIAPSEIEGLGIFAKDGLPSLILWPEALINGVWTAPGRYMNHSPTPNCRFTWGVQGYIFVTERPILPGEELTVSYREIKAVMQCGKPLIGGTALEPQLN